MIIKALTLLVIFALAGSGAILGFENVMWMLPDYITYLTEDCTFACEPRVVQKFWAAVAISALFSVAAVGSLVAMLLVQPRRG